jgi:hypothetical protein
MSRERLFLDTAFIQALLNRRDQYHEGPPHAARDLIWARSTRLASEKITPAPKSNP